MRILDVTIKKINILTVIFCFGFTFLSGAAENDAFWNAINSGDHIVMIRHAVAPGMGDPPGFSLETCSTQRNLSEEGRKQAENIGLRFSQHGINTARVFSSQWCRCLETAKLLNLGPVSVLPALNSFFERPDQREKQLVSLRKWLSEQELTKPLVLVTHQVNITGLTGVYPSSGELVLLKREKDGNLSVIATLLIE